MGDKIIFHIDVNSAFLSWEAADRLQHGDTLDLRDVPSVVGGDESKRHGIVLAKSIPAKKFNIKTGESLFSARMKCSELIIVPPNYNLYMRCSSALHQMLMEYSPYIQPFSVDEYFLDCTGMENHFGSPLEAAHKIKNRIKKELGFTVNIGISTNKLLAKMASEFEKPDKVHTLFKHEIPQKMWPLPVEELFMVGRATVSKLHAKNIFTIGDLANTDPEFLKCWLKSHGLLIWQYANGIDNSDIKTSAYGLKGIGNSTTTAFDVQDKKTANMLLLSLCETAAMRLRNANKCCRVVCVSLKDFKFNSYSHQKKLDLPTDCTNKIYQKACELFDEIWDGEPLRHMGVHLSELCESDFYQVSMFEHELQKYKALDRAIDEIRLKYGSSAIVRSCFLHSGLRPLMGCISDNASYPLMSSIL